MNISTNYSQLGYSYNSISNSKNSYVGLNSTTQEIMSRLLSQSKSDSDSKINQNSLQYVSNLKTSANSLKTAINGLQNSSVATKTAYTSSDTEKMTLQSPSSQIYSYSASSPAKSVKIEQLAQGQKNTGTALAANGKVDAKDVGYKQISIEIGGKAHQVSFEVKAGDTNKAMQEKMAGAINAAGIGVKASVSVSDGESSLQMEALDTGAGGQGVFSVKDVSGNAVALTGANNVNEEAKNAIYYLNGSSVAKTSTSNTVDIGGGVKATFKKASDSDLTVSKGFDADNTLNLVNKFVESYNSIYKLSRDNENMGTKLFSRMVNTSKIYAPSLAKLGIGFNSAGEMTIDEDQAKKAAADGSLQNFFGSGGKNYGYMSQLTRIADDVRYNTGSFVSRDAMYSSLMYSSQGLMANNQSNLMGMLFNLTY